jgi:hypothetical protein
MVDPGITFRSADKSLQIGTQAVNGKIIRFKNPR